MHCRIHLKGYLDPSWQEWLGGLSIFHQSSGTTLLTGTLPDQAALYGVLVTLRRLNLSLLSLETDEQPQSEEVSWLTSSKGNHMSEIRKIALVTGANKGIGFEIARQLGVQGSTILVGARNQGRGEATVQKLRAEGIEAVAIQIDVTDQASIDAAAASIGHVYSKLDILVNNAGISVREGTTPPSELAIEDLRRTFDTNVLGVFAVTKAMLPLLRRSQAGRIVNLSSEMGSLSINSDASSYIAKMPPTLAYNASKTTLNALTVFFARELQDTPIKVNSVSPGYVATDLNGHSGYLTVEQGAKVPVAFAILPADGPTGGFFGANGVIAW